MAPLARVSKRSLLLFLRKRLLTSVVLVYQMIAVLAFIYVPILAYSWNQQPFIGAFVEQTLVINTAEPTFGGKWALRSFAPAFGYQVTAIGGTPVSSDQDFRAALSGHAAGETVSIALKAPDGSTASHEITLVRFPFLDQLAFLVVPYLIALVFWIISLWVFLIRYRDATGRAFTMFTTSVAIGLVSLFDLYTTHQLTALWTFGIAMVGGSLINMALIFPEEMRRVKGRPYLTWVGYALAILLAIAALPTLYNFNAPTQYATAWSAIYGLAGLGAIFFSAMILYRLYTSSSPIVREQCRWILVGMLSFLPLLVWFVVRIFQASVPFTPFYLVLIFFFPLSIAYAILRHRLMNSDYLANRAAVYALLTSITATAYGLIVTGLSMILGQLMPTQSPFIFGAIIFGMAVALIPLRSTMQKRVDKIFSRGQAPYRELLQSFGRDITQAMEMNKIVALVHKYVDESLSPSQIHFFVYDMVTDHYVASPDDSGKTTTDLRFAASSPLVQTLASRRNSLPMSESSTLPSALQTEKARIALLGAQLFIPLAGQGRLAGWLALGSRASGDPYNNQDTYFLESLCDQAALAVERAQVVSNLERRMREMNVLTRVSQGINVTLAFDDILELIYAQTNQLIPTLDFRVTLHDSFSDYLYHVFFLENDERLNERENKPLPLGQGLEQEVVRSRRPILTDDYERECRSRGVLPSTQGVFAWLSVPLNAGAETIGVMSLGSRDPSAVYTQEQSNLMQAIADQAAGAIVKARLLQESERRTRQLTSLNEVARSLTSTLELDRLLNQILQNAVEILNCEAGSLLLVDSQTDEMVFEVAAGPVANDLVGKRLQPGTGLVGKAVNSRTPIIANDVRRAKEWYEKSDEQTGFNTQDLLVVPMLVKERVIGVIEVINRKDGLPFTLDDQELLAAFTSQAAVAIENARLYTMTDQALAARVEELSVMQRIDRELNASLDVDRAIRITLSWALRQSGIEAGLVGLVEESKVRLVAYQGYTTELDSYKDSYLPEDIAIINDVITSGQPQTTTAASAATGAGDIQCLLRSAQSQVVIPLRRESKTAGIILLESHKQEAWPEESLAFLSRLSDHATIAIANAQLYAQVEAANLAKSEFVSFVSHELKNPMASIKGYTELIAKGTVGPVNDMQVNFLGTIRSNVERMATLVTDLADVSRIEAGRLRLDFAAVQVQEVIEDATRSIKAQVESKKQVLSVVIPPEFPPMWCDKVRVVQVLVNLVSNAYKYSPEGGAITICAEISGKAPGDEGPHKYVHISVKDTGFGIGPEDQKKIFQKFFRADDQAIRDAPGTGLGLNITKTLVEMQGGAIWFDSELRKGTTFHFTVPIVEAA